MTPLFRSHAVGLFLFLGLAAAPAAPGAAMAQGAPAQRPAPTAPPAAAAAGRGVPVDIGLKPRTWMDTAARRLSVQDIAEARRVGEIPLVLVGSARLGNAPSDRAALFVQLQSPRECGSAGCSTAVYLWRNNAWARVLDGVGGQLVVARTRTRGMADLLTDEERYIWTGAEYRDANPAPAVDLRPRRRS